MKSVALLIETSNAYARGLLQGIVSYLHENPIWSVFLPEQERGASPPTWLKHWRGDGVIARIETQEIAQVVKRLKMPIVDVSSARLIPELPWVETDDHRIAELAYEHFEQRGFRSLAFCGEAEFNWSRWRESSFAKLAEENGMDYHVYNSTSRGSARYSIVKERRKMSNWVQSLPKPVGIMACYDIRAQFLLDICREHEIRVPEEVAVLGVDNDELLCSLCKPQLSSVIPDTRRAGMEAAALLDRMMSGETFGSKAHLISPIGIANRQSTELYATEDSDVNHALRMIKERAFEPLTVTQLLKEISISRRSLEHRFLKAVGRTPHQEITRLRIERIQQLLLTTKLTMSKIATLTGFRSVEYMSVFFHREMKIPPGKYRTQFSS